MTEYLKTSLTQSRQLQDSHNAMSPELEVPRSPEIAFHELEAEELKRSLFMSEYLLSTKRIAESQRALASALSLAPAVSRDGAQSGPQDTSMTNYMSQGTVQTSNGGKGTVGDIDVTASDDQMI